MNLDQWEDTVRKWYELYARNLYRHCYSILHHREDAENAVQETFFKVLKKKNTFRGESHPLTWLKTVATRVCLDDLKSFHRRLFKNKVDFPPDYPTSYTPEDELSRDYEALYRHLVRLSPQQRIVISLRFFEELSLEEIANHLGVHVGTVKRHLFRALHRLRKWEEKK